MSRPQPLVTIGIPTYNRAALLKRSIESALKQDYDNIEVIVSDNASVDETEEVCRSYRDSDNRFRYVRHSRNLGPVANFDAVLGEASGSYFMWLGDDDWIDAGYISSCIRQFSRDPSMSLVSGVPEYYRNGQKSSKGILFDLPHDAWWWRVISYYWRVADNGMFYGLMRTEQIQRLKMPNMMGGDWHLIASIAAMGKIEVVRGVSVHRELGGATLSYRKIAASLGLPAIQAIFPMLSIAIGAWVNIVVTGAAYKPRSTLSRVLTGTTVFGVILSKSALGHMKAVIRSIRRVVIGT